MSKKAAGQAVQSDALLALVRRWRRTAKELKEFEHPVTLKKFDEMLAERAWVLRVCADGIMKLIKANAPVNGGTPSAQVAGSASHWGPDGRCVHCGAGNDAHHSYTCPTNLHPDKRDPVLDTIRAEIDTWENHARMEDSPLGGNVVKSAHYHGTAAGLRMAEAILHEHLSNVKVWVSE